MRAILLLFAVSMMTFGLLQFAPGDYFQELQLNPSISRDTISALREHYGTNESIVVRYRRWLTSMLRFDWGLSVAYHRPAAGLVWERGLNTLVLTTTVTILAWLAGLAAVIWAAAGGHWRNGLLRGFVSLTLAMPELVVVIALSLLAAETKWFPVGGMTSFAYISGTSFERLMDIAFHMILPGAALLIATMPVVILHASTAVAEVLNTPFITAARANGIPRLRLLLRHVLPVAANPLITLAGFSVGTLLSSALVVEAVCGWPGLGHLLLQSILQRDLNLVVAVVLVSAALLLIANLWADLLLYATDPRIRGSI